MPTIFSKSVINNIYKKMNLTSKARCKGRYPEDPTEYKLCHSQAMADNATELINRLRGNLAKCGGSPHPENCTVTLEKLIQYLESKQQEYEDNVSQLRSLEG